MTIGNIIGLPLNVHGNYTRNEKRDLVCDMLEKVGLSPAHDYINSNPHELSGGQRQRVGIARAIILNPSFIVADEPVASLDVSIRAQILNLLEDLKQNYDLTYLLIAHDLTIVRHMSDRVLVLYLGKPMEYGPVEEVFSSPAHPYTQSLISAIPEADPELKSNRIRLKGEMPSAINPPKGCRFHTRCPFSSENCSIKEPILSEVSKEHFCACTLVNS
jgi:oligopeptide/dipeptide ABC transporter ATP-binding protein